jgi:hypothetical protein
MIEVIDELRRYRHIFRNLYKTRPNAGKLKIVNDAAAGIDTGFLAVHSAFVKWLELVSRSL